MASITEAEWKEYIELRDQRIWIRVLLGRLLEGPVYGSDGVLLTGEKLVQEFRLQMQEIMRRTAPLLMLVPAGLLLAGGL